MNWSKSCVVGLLFLFVFFGCGLKEGVVQKDAKSYLWFTGTTQDAVVLVDDLTPFSLNRMSTETNSTKNKYFQVNPGKHTIIVTRNGKEVVNRTVLLGDGITKEIQIP